MMRFDLYTPDTITARLEALRLDLKGARTRSVISAGNTAGTVAGATSTAAACPPVEPHLDDEEDILPVGDLVQPAPQDLAMQSVRTALAEWDRRRPVPAPSRHQVVATAATASAERKRKRNRAGSATAAARKAKAADKKAQAEEKAKADAAAEAEEDAAEQLEFVRATAMLKPESRTRTRLQRLWRKLSSECSSSAAGTAGGIDGGDSGATAAATASADFMSAAVLGDGRPISGRAPAAAMSTGKDSGAMPAGCAASGVASGTSTLQASPAASSAAPANSPANGAANSPVSAVFALRLEVAALNPALPCAAGFGTGTTGTTGHTAIAASTAVSGDSTCSAMGTQTKPKAKAKAKARTTSRAAGTSLSAETVLDVQQEIVVRSDATLLELAEAIYCLRDFEPGQRGGDGHVGWQPSPNDPFPLRGVAFVVGQRVFEGSDQSTSALGEAGDRAAALDSPAPDPATTGGVSLAARLSRAVAECSTSAAELAGPTQRGPQDAPLFDSVPLSAPGVTVADLGLGLGQGLSPLGFFVHHGDYVHTLRVIDVCLLTCNERAGSGSSHVDWTTECEPQAAPSPQALALHVQRVLQELQEELHAQQTRRLHNARGDNGGQAGAREPGTIPSQPRLWANSPQLSSRKLVVTRAAAYRRASCDACAQLPARYVVYNDCQAETSPAFYCAQCHQFLHFTQEGLPLYAGFSAFPYHHEWAAESYA